MDIQTIEDGIVSKLDAAIDDYEVLAFPGQPEEWQFIHGVGSVLVRFNGIRYSDVLVDNVISQPVTVEFAINLMLRDLRDNAGIYVMINAVHEALKGHTATIGCDTNRSMYPLDVSYVDFHEGIWHYMMVYAFDGHEIFE